MCSTAADADIFNSTKALRRDDYKCIVSRVSDWDYLVFHTAEWGDVRATKSYAWHIIPPLSNPELDPTSAFIINYFALSPEELSDLPHSLENTLTLACIVSPAIQELFTWFEADPVSFFFPISLSCSL